MEWGRGLCCARRKPRPRPLEAPPPACSLEASARHSPEVRRSDAARRQAGSVVATGSRCSAKRPRGRGTEAAWGLPRPQSRRDSSRGPLPRGTGRGRGHHTQIHHVPLGPDPAGTPSGATSSLRRQEPTPAGLPRRRALTLDPAPLPRRVKDVRRPGSSTWGETTPVRRDLTPGVTHGNDHSCG